MYSNAFVGNSFVRTIIAATALLFLCSYLLTSATKAHEYGGISMIMPDMNQTELQAIMGPPDYIQVKRRREAWQYCPRLFDGRDENLFITIWFNRGRVVHFRAYPDYKMGSCQDFFAAFRWEDMIDGQFEAPSMALGPVK